MKGGITNMNKLPILGITMGDPSGIGPEIAVKAFLHKEIYSICRPIMIGDSKVIDRAIEIIRSKNISVHSINNVKDAEYTYGNIDVYDLNNVDIEKLEYGKVQAMGGNAAFHAIKKVIKLALKGEIHGTVTNPINKEALNLAGHKYSGHTEIYAQLTETQKYTMMLVHENLRVVHISTHVSLREACDKVKRGRVYDVIQIANVACKSLGIENPKIGVAGLNPHSGENGLFGWEEKEEIIPAIELALSQGLNVEGPVPPDSLFSKALGGWYDIVVAMYHDQGHIPLKVVGFQYDQKEKKWSAVSGVNITLGLPIIRSSVDHGTAFDQAGKGIANETSLMNAIEYGAKLANSKLMINQF